MSDNELDDLLIQLKDACKKNRHHSSNETQFNNILKKIDVFINRRQMKLLNHQKRLDDLQRDLLVSESESSQHRMALEKKDFELHQLHAMLNKAEQTTENIMTKYENDVDKLKRQLSFIQKEYDRLHTINQENRPIHDAFNEMTRLRELNKKLEIDNQRLTSENEKLIQSLQHKSFENDIKISKQQDAEIQRLTKQIHLEHERHRNELESCRKNLVSDEINKLRSSVNNSEQQCNLLRLELQRVQTEKEMLKVRFLEQKLADSSASDIEHHDYERFIRNELEINIDQANNLISYWNSHKLNLEEKIRQLTNEIHQLKKDNQTKNENHLSQYNENILQVKREVSSLQMEITDKNTMIYNLYKKIECLEQALVISKQRSNVQLKEIEELRIQHSKSFPIFIDGISTDDEDQVRRRSLNSNRRLCTSSPIKPVDFQKHFRHVQTDSSSSSHEQILFDC